MAYTRTVKFSYYTVCIVDDVRGTDPKRFDFEAWIKKAVADKIEKKEIEFDNVTARLEELEGDKDNKIWKIRFIKLRDTNIPLTLQIYYIESLQLDFLYHKSSANLLRYIHHHPIQWV